ncbi:hypothetical protein B0O99DRAFT_595352 [Bisporella sp. PMI_857]|nr:hypothetical protein B0O99DRAFT_595352 [Bisporella sp. PMI_857]
MAKGAIPISADLFKAPLKANPNIESNFVNPPTLGPAVAAVGTVMASIAFLFVAARLRTNLCAPGKVGWDDLFSPCAFMLTVGYMSLAISPAILTLYLMVFSVKKWI